MEEKPNATDENVDEKETKAVEKSKEDKEDEVECVDAKKKDIEPEAVIDLASEDKEKEPRALHKTSSIFLRNLAPTITKAEVEAVSLEISIHVEQNWCSIIIFRALRRSFVILHLSQNKLNFLFRLLLSCV